MWASSAGEACRPVGSRNQATGLAPMGVLAAVSALPDLWRPTCPSHGLTSWLSSEDCPLS